MSRAKIEVSGKEMILLSAIRKGGVVEYAPGGEFDELLTKVKEALQYFNIPNYTLFGSDKYNEIIAGNFELAGEFDHTDLIDNFLYSISPVCQNIPAPRYKSSNMFGIMVSEKELHVIEKRYYKIIVSCVKSTGMYGEELYDMEFKTVKGKNEVLDFLEDVSPLFKEIKEIVSSEFTEVISIRAAEDSKHIKVSAGFIEYEDGTAILQIIEVTSFMNEFCDCSISSYTFDGTDAMGAYLLGLNKRFSEYTLKVSDPKDLDVILNRNIIAVRDGRIVLE